MDDHYATLQISPTASPAVIRAAYRVLAQAYHPDKNPDDPTAEAFLKRLNVAYAVLSDPATRRAYDAQRRSAAASADPPAPDRDEAAADATPRPDPPDEAWTVTVKGHAVTLRGYPARIIANTVWTDAVTTATRDGVTVRSAPRQQLGFRPDDGRDFFIESAGEPIPVALDQPVVLIAAQGGRLRQAEWVALWNRNTGYWYWLGHTPRSIGKAICSRAAAGRDFLSYLLRVAASLIVGGALIQWSGHGLWWLPFLWLGIPGILGWNAMRLTRTADAIGVAVHHQIAHRLSY